MKNLTKLPRTGTYLFLAILSVIVCSAARPSGLRFVSNSYAPLSDSLKGNSTTTDADSLQFVIFSCTNEMESIEVYRFVQNEPVFTQGTITRITLPE